MNDERSELATEGGNRNTLKITISGKIISRSPTSVVEEGGMGGIPP
jgi:hypothetical protein